MLCTSPLWGSPLRQTLRRGILARNHGSRPGSLSCTAEPVGTTVDRSTPQRNSKSRFCPGRSFAKRRADMVCPRLCPCPQKAALSDIVKSHLQISLEHPEPEDPLLPCRCASQRLSRIGKENQEPASGKGARTGCDQANPSCCQARAGSDPASPSSAQARTGCEPASPSCDQARASSCPASPGCATASPSGCPADTSHPTHPPRKLFIEGPYRS